jgi:hypothetical protein
MSVILTVVRQDGEMFYHRRGKLYSCWSNPNWRTDATHFKTMKYAVRVARRKYIMGYQYISWQATAI